MRCSNCAIRPGTIKLYRYGMELEGFRVCQKCLRRSGKIKSQHDCHTNLALKALRKWKRDNMPEDVTFLNGSSFTVAEASVEDLKGEQV